MLQNLATTGVRLCVFVFVLVCRTLLFFEQNTGIFTYDCLASVKNDKYLTKYFVQLPTGLIFNCKCCVQETVFSSHSENVPHLTCTNCIVTAMLKIRIFVIDIAFPLTVNDLAHIS
jgi:hypothetical protein